ncbi:MAG: metallophosphoesterase [Clostridia bacterium]|nr:metallophosphoesterase [Clostridia bacterium]
MKKTLFLLICFFCLLRLFSARAEDAVIVQATDLHHLSPTLVKDEEVFLNGLSRMDGRVTQYTAQITAAFVSRMLEMRPDAVILSGDLTFNGAGVSHAELIAALTPLIDAGIPVLVIPGNHDVGTVAYAITQNGGEGFRGMTNAEFFEAYRAFGWDGARSRDAVSFSYMYEITPTLWALMLDVNANGARGTLREETLVWAEEQLQAAREAGARVISVTHQNLLPQQSVFESGYEIRNCAELAALLRGYGVRLNLSGHLHMQHAAEEEGITDIAASALSLWPCQYAVIRVTEDAVFYDTEAVDVAAWARENGETDEDLLRFDAFALAFFNGNSAAKMAGELEELDIDAATRARMLDFAVNLNRRYYTGTLPETEDKDALALWEAYLPDSFHTTYMRRLLGEPTQDMNHFILLP